MATSNRFAASSPLTRALLWCGVVAGPLFVAVFVMEGRKRRGYSPMQQPVSALALGPRGFVQTANFIVAGTLFVAGSRGLSRAGSVIGRLVPALIGGAGVGLLAAARFPTDPVPGYPPGSDTSPPHQTTTGMLHNLASVPVFLGLSASAALSAVTAIRRGEHRWAAYSAASGATMLTTTIVAGAGFGQSPRVVDVAGLFQRVSIVSGFSWVSMACARALRTSRGTDVPRRRGIRSRGASRPR
jgi:Protein of unknown function (DUF998)